MDSAVRNIQTYKKTIMIFNTIFSKIKQKKIDAMDCYFERLIKEQIFITFSLKTDDGKYVKIIEARQVPPVGSKIELDDFTAFEVNELTFSPNLVCCTLVGNIIQLEL